MRMTDIRLLLPENNVTPKKLTLSFSSGPSLIISASGYDTPQNNLENILTDIINGECKIEVGNNNIVVMHTTTSLYLNLLILDFSGNGNAYLYLYKLGYFVMLGNVGNPTARYTLTKTG